MKIISYFENIKKANEAVSKLKKVGYNAFVDINDHYVNHIDPGTNLAGTETGQSFSGLTLGSGEDVTDDRRLGPLLAASPMASGMGGFEEVADVNCKVIVEANGNNHETAKEILSSLGGKFDNPYINTPGSLTDIQLTDGRIPSEILEGVELEGRKLEDI